MNYWVLPGIEFDSHDDRADLIINSVCKAYEKKTSAKVSVEDVKSKTRLASVVDVRSISAYLLESAYCLGCTNVGKILNRDHASVLHYWGRTRDYTNYDPLTKEVLELSKSILTPYRINWKPVKFGKKKA